MQQGEPRPLGSFVGRERELAELRVGLADVTAGHGHLFLLSGEPGIGKTRLADEFGRLALAQGVRVAWGRCWEGGGAPAYWPWIQVLRACLTGTDAEQRAAILNAEATPQVAQDVSQLLPELRAAHPTPRPPGPQPTDPEQARFQLFESVTTLLKNVARMEPLVIVMDDLHDADHSSLLLFKFIAGHSKDARILLVGTYRDTEVRQSQELSSLIGDLSRQGHSLPIVGLSEAEVGEFVANSSGRKADERLIADLYQATDGNPLFVDGVVRLLVAEGRFDRALARDAFKISDGVQGSIRRQLVKLPEETSWMLSIASVIGNEVETQLLAQVSGSAAEEIVELMESALRAGIAVNSPSGRPRYRFSHALVREALYQDLPAKRRTELHRQVGAAIEELHRDDLKPHVTALANHYRMAGGAADAEKAIDYSIRAGSAAYAVFAYEEAGAHWRAALELMDEQGGGDWKRRAKLLWRLGDELVSHGAKAVEYLEAAAVLFEELGDNQAACDVHTRTGMYLMGLDAVAMDVRQAQATLHFKRAEAFLDKQPESWRHAMFYFGMASAYHPTMQIADGLAAAKRAMELSERLELDALWPSAAILTSAFLISSGSPTEGLQLADQARRRADPIADSGSGVASIGGINYFKLADPREAQDWSIRELAKPRTARSAIRRNFAHFVLTIACREMGELTKARAYLAESSAEETPNEDIASSFSILLYEGQWELAEKGLSAQAERTRTSGHRPDQFWGAVFFARLRRFTGEQAQAVQLWKRALDICMDGGDICLELIPRSMLATMTADAGDTGQALPHLERCRRIVGAGENWLGRVGEVERAEAVVTAAQGEYTAADAHFEKAVATLQRYCLPWEEADTFQYWGRALLAAGELPRAIEKFDAAIEIYRSHGAGVRLIDYVMVDKLRAQASISTHVVAKSRSYSAGAEADIPSAEAIFRKEGEFWTISYECRTFRLKDAKGLHYIAYLLSHPGEKFRVHDLVAVVEGPPERHQASARSLPTLEVSGDLGDLGPILDDKAKASYRRRRQELRDEFDEAEAMNDEGRAERTRAEIEILEQQLSAAVGLGGRDRKTSAHAERARVLVTRNIRVTLGKIAGEHPPLGRHLNSAIKTGYLCAYLTEPERTVAWKL